jgi:membrane associated rhomboid family serine protease
MFWPHSSTDVPQRINSSADDGDTINDPSTLYSQATTSYTLNTLTNGSGDESVEDTYENLKNRAQHHMGQQNGGCSIKGDESLYTANCSTVRDDHGNKIPENAKMILGFDDAKRRKVAWKQRNQTNQAFPTLQTTDAPPEEIERRIRELAGQISADWRESDLMPPTLARRIRDFQFAREKRRNKYGPAQPWSIMGLYDHLSRVKIDVEWAEDAAWRRANKQPYLSWADFEGMKSEWFNRPFFTYLIVMACTAMMFMSMYVNEWRFEPLSVNPLFGPSADTLLLLGAKDSYLIVMEREIWRLVSPIVLHAGLIHYFLNMFALWFVSKAVEQIHGFFPTAVIFIVSAIGGIILSAIFLPGFITVGASGGIFGLIGACISDIIMNWNLFFNEFVNERGARLSHARVLVILFLDILLNCSIGLTPFIDNFTHLGGMVYGFLCGLSTIHIISPKFFGNESHRCYRCKLVSFRSVGLLVCLAGIIVSSVILFSGDGETNPCPTCEKMSCVTFPPWADKEDKWWYCDDCGSATANGTVDTTTGKFVGLNLNCPDGSAQIVGMDDSLANADEAGLENMLPILCRKYCIW